MKVLAFKRVGLQMGLALLFVLGTACKPKDQPGAGGRGGKGQGAADAQKSDKPSRKRDDEAKNEPPPKAVVEERKEQQQKHDEVKKNNEEKRDRRVPKYDEALVAKAMPEAQALLPKVMPYLSGEQEGSVVLTIRDKAAPAFTLIQATVIKKEGEIVHGIVARIDPAESGTQLKVGDPVTINSEEIVDWTLARADNKAFGQFLMRHWLKQQIDSGQDEDGYFAKQLTKLPEPFPTEAP